MIEEAFVNYETAKLMEDRGFRQNTMAFYVDSDEAKMSYYDPTIKGKRKMTLKRGDFIDPNDLTIQYYHTDGRCISAPTHQMAMAWLRVEHGIDMAINFQPYRNEHDENDGMEYAAYLFKELGEAKPSVWYRKYEDACEDGIRWALEHLIAR